MRGLLIFILVFFVFAQSPVEAFIWHPKDYKQMFLNDAYNSEKRNNHKAAFHSYEKAMYYYKKDEKVVLSYAAFCERNGYLNKAQQLYSKLYVLTKNRKYLFKSNLCAIKNGNLSEEKIDKISKDKALKLNERNELTKATIFHYVYLKKWKQAKRACDSVPVMILGKDVIANCVAASEKMSDNKAALKYYTRFYELNPKDSNILNRAIDTAAKSNNYSAQERFIKALSQLNPKDNGIKYRLAGLYERYGEWQKAIMVYEGLMVSGDLSEHVKKSHAYSRSQSDRKNHPEKYAQTPTFVYKPKPLSGYKLSEKLFYESWSAKKFSQAQKYLAQMLKTNPKSPKLLKHKVDIDVSQNDYFQALQDMESLSKVKQLSFEEKKYFAFLYSKNNNIQKSLEIIQDLLAQNPNQEDLLNLAVEYSMADKNWESARFYLEKLVEIAPNVENKFELANLYMMGKDFSKAQEILEPISDSNLKITKLYLNSLFAQQKTYEVYEFIRKRGLEDTFEGYIALGDLNLKNKMYDAAANYYFRALAIEPDNSDVKNNLAFSYRMMGHIQSADKLYNEVLVKHPDNPEAQVGLGSLEIDKKNYDCARNIFCKVLREKPDYRSAKVAIAHSYIANGEKMKALGVLRNLEPDDETRQMIAQSYYDMNMWNNSKSALKGSVSEDAKKLKYQIRKDEAITFTPGYSFMFSQLADEFNLDYHKFGIAMSKKTKGNANIFAEYNNIIYSSGPTYYLNNVTNEIKAGVQARPNEKWEYRADLGVRVFQFGNQALLTTDSWIKHYFNDKFSLKAGVKRINIEQSYLSAVGQYVDGVFTGRSADNKFYLEYDAKLPHEFYSFGRFAYGLINSQNLTTNQYLEGYAGVGRPVYNNPKNEWLQRVALELVSYNASWQYNQLEIYNSIGTLYGGYFSPGFFNATTMQVKLEGKIKKLNNLRYGVSGFGGIQNAITPDMTTPTWGYSPYIAYDINDYISINASYTHYNYADVQRDYFMLNAVIRGFGKHAKK